MMLMTDMDKDNPEDRNKVTLMTVHSAKGLEYEYVYIVGMEENLFPSLRAAESADGIEEERRLFYVALTRAKVAATLSYAEMRFRWGNMEFSRPSCFLREIDPRYVESDVDFAQEAVRRRADDGEGPSALDELRRRYDYRYQQRRQDGAGGYGGPRGGNAGVRSGGGPDAAGRGAYGGGSAGRSAYGGGRFGAPSDGESGVARRFPRPAQPQSQPRAQRSAAPDPALVQPPRPSVDGMRRVGVRQAMDGGPAAGSAAPASGGYAVGERVEHPKFGVGIVRRIETLATDHKLVVAFDNAGEKTLLAKFAKLTEGVLAQRTDFAVELVVGEDCSTDRTRAIAEEYAAACPGRVRLVTGPGNIGWRANYLRTFDACRGKYVAYCDGDDWWCDPGKLQRQVDLLEADPACGMCYTRADNFYQATGRREPDEEVHFTDFGRLLRSLTICNCTTVARRELIARYYDEVRPAEHPEWCTDDAPMWLWFAARSRIGYLPVVTAVHRRLPDSVSHSTAYRRRIAFCDSLMDISLWFDARYGDGSRRFALLRKRSSVALWVLSYNGPVGEYLARWWRDLRACPRLALCPEGAGLLVKKILFRRSKKKKI